MRCSGTGAALLVLALTPAITSCSQKTTTSVAPSTSATRSSDGTVVEPKDPPPDRIPIITMGSDHSSYAGVALAFEWIDGQGKRVVRNPDTGAAVSWTAVRAAGQLTATIHSSATPSRLDLREFSGGLDAAGAPLNQPRLLECLRAATAPTGRCAYQIEGGHIVISLPRWAPATRVIVSATWYVPLAYRGTSGVVSKSVSWAFVLIK